MILCIASDDAITQKRPIVFLPNGDHLPRIPPPENNERVVPRHAGNAGDQ